MGEPPPLLPPLLVKGLKKFGAGGGGGAETCGGGGFFGGGGVVVVALFPAGGVEAPSVIVETKFEIRTKDRYRAPQDFIFPPQEMNEPIHSVIVRLSQRVKKI